MNSTSIAPDLEKGRLDRLNRLLVRILPENRFYRRTLGPSLAIHGAEEFLRLPTLTKGALVRDGAEHPPFGSIATYPSEAYVRYHQTSGTTGRPLQVPDTPESWEWWCRCWQDVFRRSEVTEKDRLFYAFSFAPSIGFWSAFDSGVRLGALNIPGGGATSAQRLAMILETDATVLLSTPSYALHLIEVAHAEGIPIEKASIRRIIVAGEPGGSLYHTRRRIEEGWRATLIDHSGAAEVGAWGCGPPDGSGIFVNEDEFIAEVLDADTGSPVEPDGVGELVLTNLGRVGWPVIRYRTGDLVRPIRKEDGDRGRRLFLKGGILGRIDGMVTVRGVNVFPSAIENLVRSACGLSEFRTTVTRSGEMDELEIEVESDEDGCLRLESAIRGQIGIRVIIRSVDSGSLPRWEGKARRFVYRR